jgi:hypothetical protein
MKHSTNIPDQIYFKVVDDDIEVSVPKTAPKLRFIAETLNDIGAWAWEELWQPALDTLDGKRPYPYWTGGDSMEIKIEEDGTWFRDQQHYEGRGIKIPNKDAREIISRFVEAYKAIE